MYYITGSGWDMRRPDRSGWGEVLASDPVCSKWRYHGEKENGSYR